MTKLLETIAHWTDPNLVEKDGPATVLQRREAAPEASIGSPGKPLDYDQLLRQWGGKAGFVVKILETFEAEASSDIAEMEGALEAGDAESLKRLAHRIKGASATVGAERMRDLAARIEIHGGKLDIEGARDSVTELGKELDICRKYFGDRLSRETSSPFMTTR